MDWELEQMKRLSDEFEIPLEQVMLVQATLDFVGQGDELELALKAVFQCPFVG